MSLLSGLMLRVFAVVALCLACAGAWTMVEFDRTIRSELAATAERVENSAKNLAWREVMFRGNEGAHAKLAFPEWRSADALRIIGPGYCVTLEWSESAPSRICGGSLDPAAGEAPAWFEAMHTRFFGAPDPVEKTVTAGRHVVGKVTAEAEPKAAAGRAWRQVSVVLGVAGAMAVAIAVLATLAIGHALRPAGAIVRGLKRLEDGDHDVRLPAFAAREFGHVSRAFNALTERLARTTEQRASVTRRLFQVQEEERRSLARDLHDEFGQCLTATRALAAAVASSARDRPDVSESAREIGAISESMAATLRSTLQRLRPPDIDEIGLEQSLGHLVSSWNARTSVAMRRPTFRLEVVGDISDASTQSALTIYRIAQEGLTNAAKHGSPSEVKVRIVRASTSDITVSIVDDGGGAVETTSFGYGHGLLGLRERVDALGGKFVATNAPSGVSLSAIVPVAGEASAPEKKAA